MAAHKTNKDRGGTINFAEQLARDIASGKMEASAAERKKSVEYLLNLDLLRKKQRFEALSDRRKKRHEVKAVEVGTPAIESEVTPSLAERLAKMGEK